ncbi:MAG: hypothetical protein ACYCPT_11485, partial [Acidimicrobiales bacterium]
MNKSIPQRPLKIIENDFTNTVFDLVKNLKSGAKSTEHKMLFEELLRQMSIFRNVMGIPMFIDTIGYYLQDNAQHIIDEDEDFFLNMDVKKTYGNDIKQYADEQLVYPLVDAMRSQYKIIKDIERKHLRR